MPRHLGTSTLSILSCAILKIIVLLDVCPEVVALHIGSICTTFILTIGKVPTIKFLTRCWHVYQVGRSQSIAIDIGREDIREAAEGVIIKIAILIAIVNQREARCGILRLLQGIAGREQQAVWRHVSGVSQFVVVYSINRVTIVVVSRSYLISDTISIGLGLRHGVAGREVETKVELLAQLGTQ